MAVLTIDISGFESRTANSFSKRSGMDISSPSMRAINSVSASYKHLFKLRLSPLFSPFLIKIKMIYKKTPQKKN